MISETNKTESSAMPGRPPFVPSRRLESHFLALSRQLVSWGGSERRNTTIGIAGIRPECGNSTVAYNLASSLAGSRSMRCCVLEANFGKPFVSKRIGSHLLGLSDAMAEAVEIQSCLQAAGPQDVSLVGPGTLDISAASRLVSQSFDNVLQELKAEFDWVLCDLPVASPLTTCFDLAKNLDGVVLVIRPQDNLSPAVREVVSQFRESGVEVIGLVQNDC